MKPIQAPRHPWLTKDFEFKFRQALGREMTAEERAFFGLRKKTPEESEEEEEGAEHWDGCCE